MSVKKSQGIKRQLRSGALWERGCFVMSSGTGTIDEMIRLYIKEQMPGTAAHDQPNKFG